MNSNIITGSLVFIPSNNVELSKTVAKLLISARSSSDDNVIEPMITTHTTTSTFSKKSSPRKEQEQSSGSSSPTYGTKSLSPSNSSNLLPVKKFDYFLQYPQQKFVSSRKLEHIIINDDVIHQNSFHALLMAIKRSQNSNFNNETESLESSTDDVSEHVIPLEIRIPSRACSYKSGFIKISEKSKPNRQRSKSIVSTTDVSVESKLKNVLVDKSKSIKYLHKIETSYVESICILKTSDIPRISQLPFYTEKIYNIFLERLSSCTDQKSHLSKKGATISQLEQSESESNISKFFDDNIPSLNFIPSSNVFLKQKNQSMEEYGRDRWKQILDLMENNDLSFFSAREYFKISKKHQTQKKDITGDKKIVFSVLLPLLEHKNSFNLKIDPYLLNVENSFLDELLARTIIPFTDEKSDSEDSTESNEKHGDKSDNEDIESLDRIKQKKKIKSRRTLLPRPDNVLCYVIVLDLSQKMLSQKKMSMLFDMVLSWISIDSLPRGCYDIMFNNSYQINKNSQSDSKEKTDSYKKSLNDEYQHFLTKNFFSKNKTFVVILAHCPKSIALEQVKYKINSFKYDEVKLTNTIPKSNTGIPEKLTAKQLDLENNIVHVIQLANEKFGKRFVFMNIDCESQVQVNMAFQQISSIIVNQNISDMKQKINIHCIPDSLKSYGLDIKNNGILNKDKTNITGWDIMEDISLIQLNPLLKT